MFFHAGNVFIFYYEPTACNIGKQIIIVQTFFNYQSPFFIEKKNKNLIYENVIKAIFPRNKILIWSPLQNLKRYTCLYIFVAA